ncbi:hypothetical protein LJ656_09475 [Paraburkholderia sp. MMS20-SJTR3]|uniref:Secreted protein n=1 Tax=Paraburkholderia sejongensis TaxID=2886946 RepID=A0ABS8JSW4_9BURK|nr:hypothetical protein [Paraburkholderia sp. MMS20-SJTR3]MCC8392818.1 hypothetical protein [Paraburkholderia sp. MMS20-SJTR3]
MSYPTGAVTVVTCCVFTAIATAGFQCCIAATANADFDSGLDDYVQVSHASGNTPFPRITPSKIPFATQPALDDSLALCMPDLYCSLEVR